MKKNALLISPYLDVLGGGERHVLSIIKVFGESGLSTDIVWNDPKILDAVESQFSLTMENVTIVPSKNTGKAYDICIYVTDGSYFTGPAQENYVFSMYPDEKLYSMNVLNTFKLRNWNFFANGEFTADKVQQWIKKPIHVIHPYIAEEYFNNAKKEKIILSVGRFFQHLHSKRQDVLVESFLQLKKADNKYKNYVLVLAGGVKKEDEDYFEKIKKRASVDSSVILKPNTTDKELKEYYAKAELYWHAAGYRLDEDAHADGVEHLGMTPIEAMASGCVVFCFNNGGPKRYITQGHNGFLYSSIEDLLAQTSKLNEGKKTEVSVHARRFAHDHFSKEIFNKEVKEYFQL